MELTLATPSRTRLVALVGAAVVLVAAAVVWQMMSVAPPPDLDRSRSKPSEKGLYTVAIEPEGGSFSQGEMHAWLITLKNAAGAPVEDAKVSVDGGMPQHHHGLPTSPAVTAYLGGGKYRLEGVKFTMSGWWELRFAIEAAAGSDRVTFNIVL
jgi:hypothetical protein